MNPLYIYRSEAFALTGYVVPGCVEDGAWMIWENSSAVAIAVVAVLADPGWVGEFEGAKPPQDSQGGLGGGRSPPQHASTGMGLL